MGLSPLTEITALHVDDEPGFPEMVATFLERADDRLAVRPHTDVDAALDAVQDDDVDCVVSDYEMPGRDGLEFLNLVRDERPALPFVLYTGKGSEEIASEAISAGVDEYLQKDDGTDQYRVLANRLLKLVRGRRAETAVERTEERYHNLVDTAPVPILLFDREKRLVYANDAGVGLLEADSREAITGRPFTAFLHPEDRERSLDRFRTLMDADEPAPPAELRVRAVDGTIKPATVATAPGTYRGRDVAQAVVRYPIPG